MTLVFSPITASEIEFYLHGAEAIGNENMDNFWQEVQNKCQLFSLLLFKIEKERGREQFEIALAPSAPEKTIADTIGIKEIITNLSQKYDMKADFSAKPFADDYGSGLHIHIHLEDDKGQNLFFKNDSEMSESLAFSIAGLLANLKKDMPVFAPTENSKKRFVPNYNAPTTISWGANNRTTALRLPDSGNSKRIEHRVAGADSDIKKVIESIISGITYGIENKILPPPQVYGDASLDMYNLPKLL